MATNKQSARSKKQQTPTGFWARHKRAKKWLIGLAASIVLLIVIIYIAFQVSPWPNSLLIRYEFDKNGAAQTKALEKYVPDGIIAVENQQYQTNNSDGYLDVFYPKTTTKPQPTVVWVHGGAWVSGDKDNIDNYLKILAHQGYTTIGVDYTIAPEAQYPTPLLQLNRALDYIQQNADRLHVDTSKIVLAGDSAGSQIVAQVANMITSPPYADKIGIKPTLAATKLKGVLLNCGAYDLALPDYNGPFGKFLHTVLWAYSGNKDFLNDTPLKTASVANYVTKDFPPAFITAGNVDPLLQQSTEFAKKLQSLNVPTAPLFYPADYRPKLNHEYQFNLDTEGGKQALRQMIDFLQRYNQ